jgi:hypothetical protein
MTSKSYQARKAYRKHHGEIPAKYHVHHKDENPYNNEPANIEALSPSVHLIRHKAKLSIKRFEKWLLKYNHNNN